VEEAERAGCVIVDKLHAVATVADRFKLRDALEDVVLMTGAQIRRPPCAHVPNKDAMRRFSEHVSRILSQSKQGAEVPAWLVKPRVACGPDAAHQMALVFHPSGLSSQVRQHAQLVPRAGQR
jgi:hypothetical protein